MAQRSQGAGDRVARLIADTSVWVAVERGLRNIGDFIADQDVVAMSAVTASELVTGVELADPVHQKARADFVSELLAKVMVVPYTLDVARHHARLRAELRRSGRQLGAVDSMIAATSKAIRYTLVSLDAGMSDLPGVDVRVVT